MSSVVTTRSEQTSLPHAHLSITTRNTSYTRSFGLFKSIGVYYFWLFWPPAARPSRDARLTGWATLVTLDLGKRKKKAFIGLQSYAFLDNHLTLTLRALHVRQPVFDLRPPLVLCDSNSALGEALSLFAVLISPRLPIEATSISKVCSFALVRLAI